MALVFANSTLAQVDTLILTPTMEMVRLDTVNSEVCSVYMSPSRRHSVRICRYPNGGPSTYEEYIDHELYGRYLAWYPNGRRAYECLFVASCRVGMSVEFHDNGQVAASGEYYLEVDSSAVRLPAPFTDTTVTETWEGTYTTISTHPCKDQKDGLWKYFGRGGTLIRSENWRRGELLK